MEEQNRYSLQEIKDEVYYYVGKRIGDDEAKEIQWHANYHKNTSLGEIIEAFYSVDY